MTCLRGKFIAANNVFMVYNCTILNKKDWLCWELGESYDIITRRVKQRAPERYYEWQ